MKWKKFLITSIGILSEPGAFFDENELRISPSSFIVVGVRVIGELLLSVSNEQKEQLTVGIAFARLGPILKIYKFYQQSQQDPLLSYPGVLALIAYTGRLRPKEVPFSRFK